MERTLDIMEAELKAVNEQLKLLEKKHTELEREIKEYKLRNALYHPMSELINYIGREISYITLVEKKEDGKLVIDFICNDEILKVTDRGHLYYSSFKGGIIDYHKEDGKYYHYYYGHSKPHDYVGFLDIEVNDED